ncbi:MAG TPA: hypothetical protein DCS93_35165 [Microscillaceae bacterium]|nr:hypothetical protein [Microscillaceae bacterium]
MNRTIVITLWFIFASMYVTQGQNRHIDSLKFLIKQSKTDSSRAVLLNELAYEMRNIDIQQIQKYSQQALVIARKLKLKKEEIAALVGLGISYGLQADPMKGIKYSKQALTLSKEIKDTLSIITVLNNLGVIYDFQSNYAKSLEYYTKSLKLAESLRDTLGKADVLNNIANIHINQNEYDTALQKFKQALQLFNQVNDSIKAIQVVGNLAATYQRQKKYYLALEFHQRALKYNRRLGYHENALFNQGALGDCQCNVGRYKEGIHNLKIAIQGLKATNNIYFVIVGKIALGKCYLEQKNYQLSEEKLLEALKMAQKVDTPKDVVEALEMLSKLYKAKQQYKKALSYHERYLNLKDSIFNIEKRKQIANIEGSFKLEQKEQDLQLKNKQLALLQKTKVHQKLRNQMLIGALFLVAIISGLVIFTLRFRIQKKKQIIIQNKKLHKTQQDLAEARLAEEQLISENLQKALDIKNQQLSSKGLHIIQKNEMLEQIRNSLLKMSGSGKQSKNLSKVIKMIDISFNIDNDWDNFLGLFEEVHNDFFKQIKASTPSISDQDLRLCALIKLKFNTKEVAGILGITPGSVSVARHRLRKKLMLPQEQKLSDFIAAI